MEKTIECINTKITDEGLHYAKFVAEPLQKGYGITLGNSLRRILLSDLEGCAVTAIKIPGISHEFSSLPGVVEDVIDIILNLKGVVVNLHSSEPKVVKLMANRAGAVTCSDIIQDPDFEIINPDHYIATLNEGFSLEIEMMIEKSKGFLPSEAPRRTQLPLGWIPVDANFMPVKKVNYFVEDTRVGQESDYDKLTLEVWTNGSIEPVKAVSSAAMNLINQLKDFVSLSGETIAIQEEQGSEEAKSKSKGDDLTIEDLELSVRAYNCLKRANITSLSDLLKRTERELMEIKNFGRKSAEEVIERIKAMGYQLKPGGPRTTLRDDYE